MAEKVGSIYYDLDLNSSGFERGLTSASEMAKGFGGALSNYFSASMQASQTFAKGLGIVGIAAGGLTLGIVKNAADVEMLRTSFDTMLGSAEKGRDLFTKLQKMANVTPFETQDLAQASQTLLAFGINVKDLLPDLSMLGDISLGNREKFKSLALVFGQVASAGKLQGQDLLQLVNLGFNPLQKISQRTGESMASLRDKMSAGEITFKMVQDEFKRSTESGGQFFEGMDKGSQTLSGLWSTVTDNTKIMARSLVGLSDTGDVVKGGLIDKLKDAMTGFINYLSSHKDQIIGFFNGTIGWIKDHGKAVAIILTGALLPAFLGLIGAFVSMTGLLAPWVLIVTGVVMLVEFLLQRFGGLQGILKALQPTIAFFQKAWELVSVIFVTFILPVLQALWGALSQVWDALKRLWDVIGPILLPILKILGATVGIILIGAIMAAVGALYVIAEVLRFVINIISTVINWIKELIGWVWNISKAAYGAMAGVGEAIISPFRTAFDWIKNGVGKVVDVLKNLNPFTRHSPSLFDMVSLGTKAITDQYKGMFESIGEIAGDFKPALTMAPVMVGPIAGGASLPRPVQVNISAGAFMGTPGDAKAFSEMVHQNIQKISSARGATR